MLSLLRCEKLIFLPKFGALIFTRKEYVTEKNDSYSLLLACYESHLSSSFLMGNITICYCSHVIYGIIILISNRSLLYTPRLLTERKSSWVILNQTTWILVIPYSFAQFDKSFVACKYFSKGLQKDNWKTQGRGFMEYEITFYSTPLVHMCKARYQTYNNDWLVYREKYKMPKFS